MERAKAFRVTWGGRIAGVIGVSMLALATPPASAQQPTASAAAPTTNPAAANAAIHRLLHKATHEAFTKLSQPDGFWNSTVARFPLPKLFAARIGVLANDDFRMQLQHRLNQFAEAGAKVALTKAPAAVDKVKIGDPVSVLHGSATSATSAVRAEAGPRLINAIIPAIYKAIHEANDPVVEQAIHALKGVDERDVAHSVANGADNGMWFQIGNEEAAIRQSPDAGGDPELAAALGKR
jgi:Protein of unknown function (DUF4197)